MSILINLIQRKRQADWNPCIIKALTLTGAPDISTEHERLLNECITAGLKLKTHTATAWHIHAPDCQAVLFVEAHTGEEEAARQAALMPEYAVLLPHNIAPERPNGPWFALCETNWGANDLREHLRVMRLWQL